MGTKIVCAKCGAQNELGRVFCAQCGQKLDLAHTSLDELSDREESHIGRKIVGILALVLVLAVVAAIGLALWPAALGDTRKGAAGASQTFDRKVRGLKDAVQKGGAAIVKITEADVNSYLEGLAGKQSLPLLAADIREGEFDLLTGGPIPGLGGIEAIKGYLPNLTYGLTCTFYQGKLYIRSARLGHLALPGPTQGMVTGRFALILQDFLKDTALAGIVKEVKLAQDQAEVTGGR